MITAEGQLVLFRFMDTRGDDYAMEIVPHPGTSITKTTWYLDSKHSKHYISPDDLVEVQRVAATKNKPQVRIMAHKGNRLLLRYEATLRYHGVTHTVSGCYVSGDGDKTRVRARNQLAAKARITFHEVNGWLKAHPEEFDFKA